MAGGKIVLAGGKIILAGGMIDFEGGNIILVSEKIILAGEKIIFMIKDLKRYMVRAILLHILFLYLCFLLVFVYWRPIELMPIDCTHPPGTKGASIQPPLPHCGVGLCGGHVMDFVFSSVYSV